jgi:hypothetical protein
MSETRVYSIWYGMRKRCRSLKSNRRSSYIDRGITVCPRWEVFENFYEDMGEPPSDTHSLERKKNDEGYSKENCVWATATEQANNRRSSRLLTHEGRTLSAAQWAREKGLTGSAIIGRLRLGWPTDRILATPLNPQGRKHR